MNGVTLIVAPSTGAPTTPAFIALTWTIHVLSPRAGGAGLLEAYHERVDAGDLRAVDLARVVTFIRPARSETAEKHRALTQGRRTHHRTGGYGITRRRGARIAHPG